MNVATIDRRPTRIVAPFLAGGRLDARAVVVTSLTIAAAAVVFAWSLAVGDFPIAISEVLGELFGNGTEETDFIIRRLRLPRGLTALAVGAAFGLSGAILQRLARNPLASPDIIGINWGAAVGAVFTIVVVGAGGRTVTFAALGGALATAFLTYALAYRRGITGYRLILVGIGISAVMTAVTQYLLTRAQIYDVQRAMVWLTGSLNGRTWDDVRPVGIAFAVTVPLVLALARPLRLIDLGDDTARGLGVRVELVRGSLLLCSVVLAAIATASAGPVGFVALVAPQIARLLVGGRTALFLPAAATGALLVVSADLVGRRIIAPTELPVGVITAIIGAPYLLVLLARSTRIGTGG